MWEQLEKGRLALLQMLADLQKAAPAPVEPPQKPLRADPADLNRERLYAVAYGSLGRRMGLDVKIPKEVNCANAITHVMSLAGVQGLPAKGIPGTTTLYDWLRKRPEFREVFEAKYGDILIYPTGMDAPEIPGRPSLKHGHVFIVGKYQLMSNNSQTGLWDYHWPSLQAADDHYRIKGGLPRFIFRFV